MTTTIEPTVPTMPCPDWCENHDPGTCGGRGCFYEPVVVFATAGKGNLVGAQQPIVGVYFSREPAVGVAITLDMVSDRGVSNSVSMTISEAIEMRELLSATIDRALGDSLLLAAAGR